MITTEPRMTNLFLQLGLDASAEGIARFIREHQLATLATQTAQPGQSRLVLRGAWPAQLPDALLDLRHCSRQAKVERSLVNVGLGKGCIAFAQLADCRCDCMNCGNFARRPPA